jgi:hypothetical protein
MSISCCNCQPQPGLSQIGYWLQDSRMLQDTEDVCQETEQCPDRQIDESGEFHSVYDLPLKIGTAFLQPEFDPPRSFFLSAVKRRVGKVLAVTNLIYTIRTTLEKPWKIETPDPWI